MERSKNDKKFADGYLQLQRDYKRQHANRKHRSQPGRQKLDRTRGVADVPKRKRRERTEDRSGGKRARSKFGVEQKRTKKNVFFIFTTACTLCGVATPCVEQKRTKGSFSSSASGVGLAVTVFCPQKKRRQGYWNVLASFFFFFFSLTPHPAAAETPAVLLSCMRLNQVLPRLRRFNCCISPHEPPCYHVRLPSRQTESEMQTLRGRQRLCARKAEELMQGL